MILISLAVVFGALGAFSMSGGNEPATEETTPTSAAAPPPAAPAMTSAPAAAPAPPLPSSKQATTTTSGAAPTAATGAVDKSIAVRVLNNSTITGQAAKTGAQLKTSGWNVTAMENYKSSQVPESAVYYSESAPAEKAAATAIAQELGIQAKPRFSGIANAAPGVIVIMAGR